jgi:hypothetical protein
MMEDPESLFSGAREKTVVAKCNTLRFIQTTWPFLLNSWSNVAYWTGDAKDGKSINTTGLCHRFCINPVLVSRLHVQRLELPRRC